jgi:hypothetical protein
VQQVSSQTNNEYQEYGINPQYDSQGGYHEANSYYGDGKYPPDWDARRDAVWERQRYQCGRCGVYKGDTSVNEVHHVIHLQNGGSNSLDNLVGLCGHCHALMHPNVDVLNGNPTDAPVFPDENSDNRVAVVRKPQNDERLQFDVARLSYLSSSDANTHAVTEASVPTSSETARRAGQSLQQLLLSNGYVPRTSSYHRVNLVTDPSGILSAITPRSVTVKAGSDGETMEIKETDDDTTAIYYSADSTTADIELEDPAEKTRSEHLQLQHRSGSRLVVEKPISAPPLTISTVPEYAVGALKYFGWKPAKIGLIPGLIIAVLLSFLLSSGISVGAVIGLIFVTGELLRAPAMYNDIVKPPADRVVDKRNKSS